MIISSNYLQMAMSNTEDQITEQLKLCCKDEDSYRKLKSLFIALKNRNLELENQLNLLEHTIRDDYDSIMITDLNLSAKGPQILYVNDAFTAMTGYHKHEVIGKTPDILYGPKTNRRVIERMKEKLNKGESFAGHTVNYKKDGSEFINQWDIHPLTNENGDVINLVAYQRDISDKNESTKLILDSDRARTAENTPASYVDLDGHGFIINTNLSFRKLTGYDWGELKGRPIWDLVTESNRDEVEYIFSDFDHNNGGEKSYRWNFSHKTGESFLLEGNIETLTDDDGLKVRVYFHNITMRNKVIESLRNKKRQLEEMLAKKDEFIIRFAQNKTGEIVCEYISDSVQNITGYHPDVIIEKGIYEILSEEDRADAKRALQQAFDGEATTIRCRYKTLSGEEIPALQSFRPDENPIGNDKKSVKSVVLLTRP